MVATAETILNRKSGDLASRRRLGALCALAVGESVESEKSVDNVVSVCRCGENQSPFIERSGNQPTYVVDPTGLSDGGFAGMSSAATQGTSNSGYSSTSVDGAATNLTNGGYSSASGGSLSFTPEEIASALQAVVGGSPGGPYLSPAAIAAVNQEIDSTEGISPIASDNGASMLQAASGGGYNLNSPPTFSGEGPISAPTSTPTTGLYSGASYSPRAAGGAGGSAGYVTGNNTISFNLGNSTSYSASSSLTNEALAGTGMVAASGNSGGYGQAAISTSASQAYVPAGTQPFNGGTSGSWWGSFFGSLGSQAYSAVSYLGSGAVALAEHPSALGPGLLQGGANLGNSVENFGIDLSNSVVSASNLLDRGLNGIAGLVDNGAKPFQMATPIPYATWSNGLLFSDPAHNVEMGLNNVGITGLSLGASAVPGMIGYVSNAGNLVDSAAIAAESGMATRPIGDLRSAGLQDAHHVIQDAAVRDLPGYDTNAAPGVQLAGPSTSTGTPHYIATQIQRLAGGGTYGAERQIAYNALRAVGYTDAQATQVIQEADRYFNSIGANENTPTRIPGNRR